MASEQQHRHKGSRKASGGTPVISGTGGQQLSTPTPTPLETWAQQRTSPTPSSSSSSTNSRRLLPLPNSRNKPAPPESESARNVRLLLARHQQQEQQQQRHLLTNGSSEGTQVVNGETTRNIDKVLYRQMSLLSSNDEGDGSGGGADGGGGASDQFASALLPGDSFPDTGEDLLDVEDFEDDEDGADEADDPDGGGAAEDAALLRRLRQSQSRMEQIKRMLVTQRGFIVKSLRQVAEQQQQQQQQQQQRLTAREQEEKDRTLGNTVRHSAHRIRASDLSDASAAAAPVTSDHVHEAGNKLCPMCEVAFPADVDDEAFESHVVEHFCLEDAETLKYVGGGDDDGDEDEGEGGNE